MVADLIRKSTNAIEKRKRGPAYNVAPPLFEEPRCFLFVDPRGLAFRNISLEDMIVKKDQTNLDRFTLRIACWFKTGQLVAEAFWKHENVC